MARALSKKLTVPLDEETHDKLTKMADEKDIAAAALARTFIRKALGTVSNKARSKEVV